MGSIEVTTESLTREAEKPLVQARENLARVGNHHVNTILRWGSQLPADRQIVIDDMTRAIGGDAPKQNSLDVMKITYQRPGVYGHRATLRDRSSRELANLTFSPRRKVAKITLHADAIASRHDERFRPQVLAAVNKHRVILEEMSRNTPLPQEPLREQRSASERLSDWAESLSGGLSSLGKGVRERFGLESTPEAETPSEEIDWKGKRNAVLLLRQEATHALRDAFQISAEQPVILTFNRSERSSVTGGSPEIHLDIYVREALTATHENEKRHFPGKKIFGAVHIKTTNAGESVDLMKH